MSLDVTILGTGSGDPTKERHNSAIYLDAGSEAFLLDCGEGTRQRIIEETNLKINKIALIGLSHWHIDHTLGLLDVLRLISAYGRTPISIGKGKMPVVYVFGPEGTQERFDYLTRVYTTTKKMNLEVRVNEINKDKISVAEFKPSDNFLSKIKSYKKKPLISYNGQKLIYEGGSGHNIVVAEMNHRIPCIAYSIEEPRAKVKIDPKKLKEYDLGGSLVGELIKEGEIQFKGKKIKLEDVGKVFRKNKFVYIPDTAPCQNIVDILKGATDVVIETTYLDTEKKLARKNKHLIPKDIVDIIKDAGLNEKVRIFSTHISPRYRENKDEVFMSQIYYGIDKGRYINEETSLCSREIGERVL